MIRDGNVVSLRDQISNLLNNSSVQSDEAETQPILITSSRANSDENIQSGGISTAASASNPSTSKRALLSSSSSTNQNEDENNELLQLQRTIAAPRRNTVLRIMGPKSREFVLKMKSNQTIGDVRKLLQPHLNNVLMVIGHSTKQQRQQHDYDLRTAVQPPQLTYEPYMTLEECGLVPGARMHLVFRNK